jgi:hypothetical protein
VCVCVCFFLEIFVDYTRTSFVARRMITTAEDTSNIARSFFAMTMNCQVIAGAFDATRFYVAVVSSVAVTSKVWPLRDVPLVLGRLESNFCIV